MWAMWLPYRNLPSYTCSIAGKFSRKNVWQKITFSERLVNEQINQQVIYCKIEQFQFGELRMMHLVYQTFRYMVQQFSDDYNHCSYNQHIIDHSNQTICINSSRLHMLTHYAIMVIRHMVGMISWQLVMWRFCVLCEVSPCSVISLMVPQDRTKYS